MSNQEMIKVRVFDFHHELLTHCEYQEYSAQEIVLYFTKEKFEHILEYQYDTDLTEYITSYLDDTLTFKKIELQDKLKEEDKIAFEIFDKKSEKIEDAVPWALDPASETFSKSESPRTVAHVR